MERRRFNALVLVLLTAGLGNGCFNPGQADLSGSETVGNETGDISVAMQCGNQVIDLDEDCDPSVASTVQCSVLELPGDTATCNADCTLDRSTCQAERCGDGEIQTHRGEQCEPTIELSVTCTTLGYTGGPLDCTDSCLFDFSSCDAPESCGDGTITSPEQCEPDQTTFPGCAETFPGVFDLGITGCQANCTYDLSDCRNSECGNDIIEPGEDCEPGLALPVSACNALPDSPFYEGKLACNDDCKYDTSSCEGCIAGVSCDTGNPCEVGQIDCSSGEPQCISTSTLANGTSCGQEVISTGQCTFPDLCAIAGIQTRTTTQHVCESGQCEEAIAEEQLDCSRSASTTNGLICQVEECSERCRVIDLGGAYCRGEGNETVRTCTVGACAAGSCDLQTTYTTIEGPCIDPSPTDGDQCSADGDSCCDDGVCSSSACFP